MGTSGGNSAPLRHQRHFHGLLLRHRRRGNHQSCLPGETLDPVQKAVNPLLATIGGVIGPVTMYFLLNYFLGSPNLIRGWGIPTATDIALAWLAARLVFGTNHPVIAFLLLLAIADDAIGLVIIAVFYPRPAPAGSPLVAISSVCRRADYLCHAQAADKELLAVPFGRRPPLLGRPVQGQPSSRAGAGVRGAVPAASSPGNQAPVRREPSRRFDPCPLRA